MPALNFPTENDFLGQITIYRPQWASAAQVLDQHFNVIYLLVAHGIGYLSRQQEAPYTVSPRKLFVSQNLC